jgi:hypothetical protein
LAVGERLFELVTVAAALEMIGSDLPLDGWISLAEDFLARVKR